MFRLPEVETFPIQYLLICKRLTEEILAAYFFHTMPFGILFPMELRNTRGFNLVRKYLRYSMPLMQSPSWTLTLSHVQYLRMSIAIQYILPHLEMHEGLEKYPRIQLLISRMPSLKELWLKVHGPDLESGRVEKLGEELVSRAYSFIVDSLTAFVMSIPDDMRPLKHTEIGLQRPNLFNIAVSFSPGRWRYSTGGLGTVTTLEKEQRAVQLDHPERSLEIYHSCCSTWEAKVRHNRFLQELCSAGERRLKVHLIKKPVV